MLVVVVLCGGGCIYVVVVAVHGGFAAVTQPRIHLEERFPHYSLETIREATAMMTVASLIVCSNHQCLT